MKFKKIYIELSDICGLNCHFCPTKKNKRGKMSLENFEKIAKQIWDKSEIFTFHLLGDPLILKDLESYLELALKYKMKLEITTSGFYLSEANQALLLKYEHIAQINFSLMSFLSLENQKKMSFDEYFSNILAFCTKHFSLKKENFINLRLWNLDKNFIPPKENLEIYALLNEHFKTQIPINSKSFRLARRIFLHQAKLFKWANLNDENVNFQGYCHALKSQVGILSNGILVPCCLDVGAEISLGNVLESSFETLLNSHKFRNLKQAFLRHERIEKLCQKCEFYSLKSE